MYYHPGRAQPRRGTSAILTVVCLTGILFLAALAIDGTNMMACRRHAQNCSDAAALAGCIKLATLKANGSTPTSQQIKDAANLSATNNNYTTGQNCTVTVNWPPTSGSNQNTNSVEVLLTFTYSNLVIGGSNSVTVRSVATCDPSSATTYPFLLLEPSLDRSFWVNSGKFTLSASPVQVNSDNANAAVVEGSALAAANATVRAVGSSSGSFTPSAKGGANPMPDPYALLPEPSTSGMTTYSTASYLPNSSGNITLNPGYYPNGLYCINGGNVTLNPGVYYIQKGNFWINTSGTVTGNGVTIFHAGAASDAKLNSAYGLDVGICLCPTNGTYNFTPPTTGTYAGVSFFQSRSYTGQAFYDLWGTGKINAGLQYLPDGQLRAWTKTTSATINSNELVARKFKLTGTHEIYGNTQNGGFSTLTWNNTRATNKPATSVYLVE